MKNTRARSRDFGKGDWKSYFRLIPYIRLPWLLIAVAFVVDLVYSDVMAYVPVSTSALFGGEFTGRALASAVLYNVLNFGLMFASLILTSVVSSIAVRRAQEVLWGRMLRLDMAYYDTNAPANLMSTLTNDTDTAVKSLISQLVSLIPGIYYLVRVCMTLRSYDFRLLLSILLLIPVNILYVVVLGRWRYEVNAGINSRIGRLTAYLAERVSNIYLIRSFTNEAQEEKNGLEAAGRGEEAVADGDIAFENVRFSYGDKEVLHGVSASIPQGKTTALVGRCGSGKTTLLSLLERLYTPQDGRVTMGGRNIADYDLRAYRNHFAYVQQDAGIFGGTFRSAMTYGLEREASEAELTEAAEKTGIMPLVRSVKGGFDTGISISGGSVSGGQRQRIVLSRELLKSRPVMLLDEPTSALDAMSALEIQQKLIDLFPGATKLMITHDLRLLSQVDHVLFMENGRVLDSGSHRELMSRCGAYRTLVLCDEEVSHEKEAL